MSDNSRQHDTRAETGMCLMMGAARDGWATAGGGGGGTGACRTVGADGELESLGDGVKEVGGPTAALEGGRTETEADKGALWDRGMGHHGVHDYAPCRS